VAAGLLTKRQLDGAAWHRLLPDVYVHKEGFDPTDHRLMCDAAALIIPRGAVIGGLSAAYLWGVNLLGRDAPVSIIVEGGAGRVRPHPRLRVTAHAVLAPADVTRFAGLPVTSPIRTTYDLGRQPPRLDALIAVDALLHRRVVKLAALAAYAEERPGWRGAALVREVIALAEPLTESPMETTLRLILIDGGLPRPVAQHEIVDPRGRLLARVDLAYPELRIALEYEGDHHRERDQFRRDITRYKALHAAGWLILRFTARDITNPAAIVADVRRARTERTS